MGKDVAAPCAPNKSLGAGGLESHLAAAMSELTFPQLLGGAQQCLGQGWKLGLAGLSAPAVVACKPPPSWPMVPQD